MHLSKEEIQYDHILKSIDVNLYNIRTISAAPLASQEGVMDDFK